MGYRNKTILLAITVVLRGHEIGLDEEPLIGLLSEPVVQHPVSTRLQRVINLFNTITNCLIANQSPMQISGTLK